MAQTYCKHNMLTTKLYVLLFSGKQISLLHVLMNHLIFKSYITKTQVNPYLALVKHKQNLS